MRKMEWWGLLLCRTVVGCVFLWASYAKILDPGPFALSVANYHLVPVWGVNLMAVGLPWLEFGCALLLLSGQWVRTSSFLVAGLLAVFMTAVGISMARGLDVNCGCFSASSGRKIGFKLLGEDLLLLAMTAVLFFRAGDALGWKAFLGLQESAPHRGTRKTLA
jgi:uncharacterized membrane protein YphA (DoxX/SURF4 family)